MPGLGRGLQEHQAVLLGEPGHGGVQGGSEGSASQSLPGKPFHGVFLQETKNLPKINSRVWCCQGVSSARRVQGDSEECRGAEETAGGQVRVQSPACLQEGDLPLLLQVGLVAHHEDDDGWAGQGPGVRQPGRQAVEGLPRGDVVYEESPGRAAVVAAGDAAESLLAGRVPDLQLHCLAAHWHYLYERSFVRYSQVKLDEVVKVRILRPTLPD